MGLFASDTLFWFVLGFIFLILEVATPGVVFVFFGFGSWLVMLLTFIFPISEIFQFLIFIISSVAFLAMLRRHLKTFFYKTKEGGRVDSLSEKMVANNYIGQVVEVIKEIGPDQVGLVEINGTNWNAQSEDVLAVGERAKVVDILGLTVTVEKVKAHKA
ncbi:MAG: NfeD family protein [Deltaproteobacteria bacterium]|jgi:membrane protein implicated in regulation of membrane protease activity|nr:NfeD family protein [Deltaproteobacteria bacterium]